MSESVLNGRYHLDELIGEGGMATVYRGQDLLLNRQVAIKILRPQYAADAGFLKRFEREAQAAAGFAHPNIVNVYDVGSDSNQHYIIMEYIRGPNLKELIRRQGPFSVDGAIYIICQVASALDYAHQRELIHRDIKPQNILVDREGNAKVVDFGIAKGIRDTNLTEAGTGMGTVHYVSPEQARGEPATPASDLYSTGVVLYEMLTKRLPFEADTPIGVAMLHVNQPPPSPMQFNPAIPPRVEAIVLQVLSKNPAERYPNAASFANALRHWDVPEEPRHETMPLVVAAEPPRRESSPAAVQPQPVVYPVRRVQPARPPVGPMLAEERRRTSAPTTAARDEVGCATWLIGAAILLAIIGLMLLAFRFVPDALGDDTDSSSGALDALPTPTAGVVEAAPTETPEVAEAQPTDPPTAGAAPTSTAEQATVASDQPSASVPELAGATVNDAEAAIAGRWELSVVEEASSEVTEGLIVSQSPGAGSSLADGGVITIVVSSGPDLLSIPAVAGMSTDEAVAAVTGAGFDYELAEEPNTEFEEGIVVRSEPDSTAESGTTVVIVTSLGDVVPVPDVTGEDIDTATTHLLDAALEVGIVATAGCEQLELIVTEFDCDAAPDGGVAIMSATPGMYAPRGSSIDLIIYAADQ